MTDRHNWTPQENEQIKELLRRGKTSGQIHSEIAFQNIAPGALRAKCQSLKKSLDIKGQKVVPIDRSNSCLLYSDLI
jgi:hypothetical protein